MRNILVLILAVFLLVFSFSTEPVSDTVDAVAGATNDTYGPLIDSIAGASHDDDHEDEDEHEDEDDD